MHLTDTEQWHLSDHLTLLSKNRRWSQGASNRAKQHTVHVLNCRLLSPNATETWHHEKPVSGIFDLRVWNKKLILSSLASHSWASKWPEATPWLVWLSGLSTRLRNRASSVGFPVRAQAWVAGQLPSRGRARGNHLLKFLSLSFSFPSPLSKINK